MIREVLIKELRASFPDIDFEIGDSLGDPIAIFGPAHPEVGELSIWDHGR